LSKTLAGLAGSAIDRRAFLKRSGLTAGGAAIASTLPLGMVKKAAAQAAGAGQIKKVL
jgi:formate dehydrogenase major subunit